MAILTKEFQTALSTIEPDTDVANAIIAHNAVSAVLLADPKFTGWGFDPVLIGSYKRHVSIKRIKDVDVFCRLRTLDSSVGPIELLAHTERVLRAGFPDGDRVTLQGRSVQVDFPDLDLSVDAVPSRPRQDRTWDIPCKDPGDGWEQTDPEHFTDLTSEMNKAHASLYVPTVKLMRQTRRALVGSAKPSGLFMEVMTYWAFHSHPAPDAPDSFTSQAEYFTHTLAEVQTVLLNHTQGDVLQDPALPGQPFRGRASAEELADLLGKLSVAARSAEQALQTEDPCEAARLFRAILGTDSVGEVVFPLPNGCDSYADSKAGFAIQPGAEQLPAESSPRFG